MPRVLLAHQAAGEQREAGLHEEHQVSGVERPCEVRAHPEVPHRIGELHRQRFLLRLSLEFIGVLLALCVIGSRFVGRFGDHESVAAGVHHIGLVSGCDPGRIRLGIVRHEGRQRRQQDADG